MEAVKVLLVIFSTILWVQGAKDGDDIGRPYEFGFTIDGEQHRHEKKDANGIIQGEFGFITADGVYHVTVYATDENGSFRILSMRNIKISPPLDGSKDYSPSNAQYKQPQIPGQSPAIPGQSPTIPGQSPPNPGQSPTNPGQSPPNPGAPAKLQNLPSTTTFRTTVLTTPRPVAISTTPQGPYTFTTLSTIKPGCAGCGYVTQPAKFQFQNPAVREKEQKLSNQNLNRPSPQSPPVLPPYSQNPSTQPSPIQNTLAQNQNPQTPFFPPSTENVNPQPPSYQNPNNQVSNPQFQNLNQFPNPQAPSYPNPNNQALNPQVQNLNQFQPPGFPPNNQNPVFNQAPSPIFSANVENPFNNQNQLAQISQPPSSNENLGQPPSFQNPSGFSAPVNTLQPPGSAENPQAQASTPAPVNPNYPEYVSNDVNDNQNLPQQIQNLSPISRVDSINVSNGVINVPNNPPIQIVDKYPGMTEGLPEGITEGDITDLLYKFNYTVGFHGHYEKGWRNGTKIGGYFVNGRDGISRIVTYVADEFGYRPKFRLVNLGFDSPDTPKEDTEKKFGLKSFEFVWYPLK